MFGEWGVLERLARGGATETAVVVRDGRRGVAKRLNPRLRGDGLGRAQIEVEAGEDGEGPWLVMEHVALETLEACARSAGEGRSGVVARVVGAVLGALAEVHEADDDRGALLVVHGDVSPENVLVSADGHGEARLIDFGLASFRDADAARRGPFRGTVRYVAPEVARGEPATIASDLFSLGLSLLHAASGEPPRPGDQLAPLVVEAGEVPVTHYATRASHALDAALREALLALVAFDPKDRPRSAREAQLVVEGAHGSR